MSKVKPSVLNPVKPKRIRKPRVKPPAPLSPEQVANRTAARANQSKHYSRSKTVIANAIVALLGVLAACGNSEWVACHPSAVTFLASAVATGNIILRFFTSGAIRLK